MLLLAFVPSGSSLIRLTLGWPLAGAELCQLYPGSVKGISIGLKGPRLHPRLAGHCVCMWGLEEVSLGSRGRKDLVPVIKADPEGSVRFSQNLRVPPCLI